jgi:hypothetical protein
MIKEGMIGYGLDVTPSHYYGGNAAGREADGQMGEEEISSHCGQAGTTREEVDPYPATRLAVAEGVSVGRTETDRAATLVD